GTPLANALWRTGHELLQRPEPRRLVVVATDGEPDDLSGVDNILVRCRASGIEIVGLGIGQSLDHVQAVFGVRHAVSIATIEALAPALFAVLERQLVA
ncbi:MAG: VWA domain-containing protein, partial [Rhizobium sp.]